MPRGRKHALSFDIQRYGVCFYLFKTHDCLLHVCVCCATNARCATNEVISHSILSQRIVCAMVRALVRLFALGLRKNQP